MFDFLQRYGFLLALLAVLIAGILAPQQLAPLADRLPQDVLVATVMFAMSLSLESESIRGAIRSPRAVALASAVNLGLLPPLGWLFGRVLPAELADGLVIAASVPCTVASAAVWTRRAGGNEAVAIAVTLVTNLACFLVTPAWIDWLCPRGNAALGDFSAAATRLALIVAAPVAVGQGLRRLPLVERIAHRRRMTLGYYSQLGILAMAAVGAVRCGEQLALLDAAARDWAGPLTLAAVVTVLLHLIAWGVGLGLAGRLGCAPADRAAVAFSGSQKTLMVGLAVAVKLGGMAVLPMVAYHVLQLLVDTPLADWLRRRNRSWPLAVKPVT